MATAAFSMPSDPQARITIAGRSKNPTSATSAAADEALRRLIDERRLRHKHGHAPEPRRSVAGSAFEAISSLVSDTAAGYGLSRWALRAIVLAGVGGVLAMAAMAAVPKPGALHGIAGSVSVAGKPLADGTLEFHLTSPSPTGEPFWLAVYTNPDGTFRRDASAGVPAGTYAVVVKSGQVVVGKRSKAAVIPAKYMRSTSTPLTVEIKQTATTLNFVVRK